MSNISAVILTKNEEMMIADCIDSVSFCNEIVVIDSGSTDNTSEIAKNMGAVVYLTTEPDFAKKRNYGLKKAKGPWVLYVDADERVEKDLQAEINKVIAQKNTESAYRLKRKNFYLGNNEWPKIEKLERLFKKTALKEWKGELHETPVVEGAIGELEGFLLHFTHRELSTMLAKTIEWSGVEANLRYNANHPKMTWWRFPRVMITTFYDWYIVQKGWKVGAAGLIESIYQSFSIFITYARLWELQQTSTAQHHEKKDSNN